MHVHTNWLQSPTGGINLKGDFLPRCHCSWSETIYLLSAGPIIEQGTHFCDLSRYFGGEIDISSVQAHSLEWHENAGKLSKMPIDESKILPENRIPRVTAANWYDHFIPTPEFSDSIFNEGSTTVERSAPWFTSLLYKVATIAVNSRSLPMVTLSGGFLSTLFVLIHIFYPW